ncbi:hypothetical protein GIHI108528_16545 [Gillisia hiemivivida]
MERNDAYNLSFMAFIIASLSLLFFAIEGLICIIMASPILLFGGWIGSYLGYKSSRSKFLNQTNTTIILLALSLGFMSFDYINEPINLISVKTKVIVNAPINEVWENVITFDKIDEPKEWIFKTGIAYPTNATIKGTGVGAVRYCNFSTGSFVEPITTWNKPNLLQFSVQEQPIPMNEFNPFWEVHPPHLDGYFKSYKGQFKLISISENITELEGTTWYKVDINPEFYWRFWSDLIIHKIHKRVLIHIKQASEN